MALQLPPVTLLRAYDTCRLIPSRFVAREDSVVSPLAENDADLQALFDLENATNERMQAEAGRNLDIGVDELVSGVPHFRIVNAAFCYPRPEGSRFNSGTRGAWYSALDQATALAEVVFHKTLEYQEINWFHDQVMYQEFLADFSASLHDLRGADAAERYTDCLNPVSYVASQALAQHLLEMGSLGIVYPSVRRKRGVNLVSFRPALVGNVRQGAALKLEWSGTPAPRVTPIG